MSTPSQHQQQLEAQGAALAPDGVPLHFGSVEREYHAALHAAVLMDRSHEGRLTITGADRLEILHRISTNDLHHMAPGEGRATVFTNANARIIDRVLVYNRADHALILTDPGRGSAVSGYLQRQIFFNDDARLQDISATSHQFVLHGTSASAVVQSLGIAPGDVAPLHGVEAVVAGTPVFIARQKSLSGAHWSINVFDTPKAADVWRGVLEAGQPAGLMPAGALAYNMIRIRSGRPAFGRELTPDYIPLEVGLWDEVSFSKGCYTGQEVIARMESRSRMAKVMVRLQLSAEVQTPAVLLYAGKSAGTLTSAVRLPDGEVMGVGVVKTKNAASGATLSTETGETATVIDLAAASPPPTMLQQEN
jgi:tRNA-modifying protein YgfZ